MKPLIGFAVLLLALIHETTRSAAADDSTPIILQLPNEDVGIVLALYGKLAGCKIVQDNFVQGKISVVVPEPISREKAIEIIERTLWTNGFAILDVSPDTVEVVGPGKNPRGNGIRTISDPNDMPVRERLISYLFSFKHLDAKKTQQVFAQYLSPPKYYTSFLLVPETNAVWVTERSSVIRNLIDVVEKLELEAANTSSRATP
jgi:general secretion pathway protein D